MLLDRFDKICEYIPQIAHLDTALDFIRNNTSWEPGRYEIDGGYILYQDQNTKPLDEGTYENHKLYVDIQVLLEGEGWCTLWNRVEEMTEAVPYDEVKDAARWIGDGTVVSLKPGMFVCFFPTDAHKPDRHMDGATPSAYKKYVIKLRIPDKN